MYCSKDDVLKRIPAAVNLDEGLFTAAVNAAEAEINVKLGGRYKVPFNTVPVIINSIASDLAASFVTASSFSGGGEAAEPVQAKFLRDRAEALLIGLAEGSVSIAQSEGQAVKNAGIWVSCFDRSEGLPFWADKGPY